MRKKFGLEILLLCGGVRSILVFCQVCLKAFSVYVGKIGKDEEGFFQSHPGEVPIIIIAPCYTKRVISCKKSSVISSKNSSY